jgi:HlyD family secretion protein
MESLPMTFCVCMAAFYLAGCGQPKDKDFIGSASVESKTYQVATTSQGMIVSVSRDEGMAVTEGELIAIIDTVPFALKVNEIISTDAQLTQTIAAKKAEISSQEFDLSGIQRECRRISGLADQGALPMQQKDNIQTQTDAAVLRLKAARLALESLARQKNTLNAQIAGIRDQIKRCYVYAPCKGIVLTRYKNPGEVALPGNPIYEICRYDTMQIDFYVPQPMLSQFKIGQPVSIHIDNADSSQKKLPASVSWISNDAEFSPKNIQTRESRNELVFKIRAMVSNTDGILKRGMPVEVWKQK